MMSSLAGGLVVLWTLVSTITLEMLKKGRSFISLTYDHHEVLCSLYS